MAIVIQKTKIEIDSREVVRAQNSLDTLGVKTVDFAKKAENSAASTKGFGEKIGDLSVAFDRKLEGSLGRAFKATDRLQSVLGQAGAVGAMLSLVIAGTSFAYDKLTDSTLKAEAAVLRLKQAQKRSDKEMARQKETAEAQLGSLDRLAVAVGVTTDAFSDATRAAHIYDTDERRRLKKARLAAKERQLFAERQRDLAIRKIKSQSSLITAAKTKAAAAAAAAEILSQQRRAKMRNEEAMKASLLVRALERARDKVQMRINKRIRKLKEKFGTSKVKPVKIKVKLDVEKITNLDDLILPPSLDEMISRADNMLMFAASANEVANGLRAIARSVKDAELNDVLEVFNKNIELMPTSMNKAQRETVAFSNALSGGLADGIDATGDAFLRSSFDALAYGASLGDLFNDFLEAQTKEASVSAIMEGAKGLAQLAIGNAVSAQAHFGAAAAFGTVATASFIGAMATGGFNGPAGEDGQEDVADSGNDFTGAAKVGSAGSAGPTETVINLNFTAAGPIPRIERQRMAQELQGLMLGR